MAVVELDDFTCRMGGRTILHVERFSLERGEILGILGGNGAGKSTLLKGLALLFGGEGDFDWKRFDLFGKPVPSNDPAALLSLRRRLALVLQKAHLLDMTLLENVALPLVFRGMSRREARDRALEYMELLGVARLSGRMGHEVSGGEAQRVAIARALAVGPEILLLDEAFSQLDQPGRVSLLAELGRILRRRSQTTVFVTHDRSEILGLADRVAVLSGGRVLQVGTVGEVFAAPATPEVAAFVGMDSVFSGKVKHSDGQLAEIVSGGLVLTVACGDPVGSELLLALNPAEVTLELENGDGLQSPDRGGRLSSARNHIPCLVSAVEPRDGMSMVSLRPLAQAGGRVERTGGINTVSRQGAAGPWDDCVRGGPGGGSCDAGPADQAVGRDGAPLLKALLTRRSLAELDLRPGMRVVAVAKAGAFHVFRSY